MRDIAVGCAPGRDDAGRMQLETNIAIKSKAKDGMECGFIEEDYNLFEESCQMKVGEEIINPLSEIS